MNMPYCNELFTYFNFGEKKLSSHGFKISGTMISKEIQHDIAAFTFSGL